MPRSPRCCWRQRILPTTPPCSAISMRPVSPIKRRRIERSILRSGCTSKCAGYWRHGGRPRSWRFTAVLPERLQRGGKRPMAITNTERVGKALDVLNDGLRPYVERELKATYKDRWLDTARPSFPDWQHTGKQGKELNWDTQALL